MADIVGSIRPQIEVSESAGFAGPTRTVDFSDPAHGLCLRIQWRSGPLDNAILREVAPLVSLISSGVSRSSDSPASEGA